MALKHYHQSTPKNIRSSTLEPEAPENIWAVLSVHFMDCPTTWTTWFTYETRG